MIPIGLAGWMIRHQISAAAMAELAHLTGLFNPIPVPPPPGSQRTEGYVQSLIRLEAPRAGVYLFRNNVGALKDEDGRVVRYGLANDSKALNEKLKSHDLIGVRPVTITQAHLGCTIGQFVSRECKPADWTYTGTPREVAQNAWALLINAQGGDAKFATGVGTL